MKKTVLMLFCAVICVCPAWSQAALSGTDQQFANTAAQTDMLEAHMGQVAQEKSSNQGIKDFAQMLVTDHTNDYQQLSTIVKKDSGTVPNGLDAARNRMIAPFEKLKGPAFDRRFLQDMVAGHQKAIAEYEREAKDGQNPDLKSYANQALPTLHKHLDTARDLEKHKGK